MFDNESGYETNEKLDMDNFVIFVELSTKSDLYLKYNLEIIGIILHKIVSFIIVTIGIIIFICGQ